MYVMFVVFFFKQKTADELRISDWSSDVCSSDLTLAVDNMYCEACPYIVKESLARVPGVQAVIVSYEQKSATVTYDDQETTLDKIGRASCREGECQYG